MTDTKINSNKCMFGLTRWKFLGYMVNAWGIQVNPKKIQAIIYMEAPKTIWNIQKLTGQLVFLKRFTSRSTKKALSFFKVF